MDYDSFAWAEVDDFLVGIGPGTFDCTLPPLDTAVGYLAIPGPHPDDAIEQMRAHVQKLVRRDEEADRQIKARRQEALEIRARINSQVKAMMAAGDPWREPEIELRIEPMMPVAPIRYYWER